MALARTCLARDTWPCPWLTLASVVLSLLARALALDLGHGLICLALSSPWPAMPMPWPWPCLACTCLDLASTWPWLACVALLLRVCPLGHGFTWLLSHCLQLALALALACHALALRVFACSDLASTWPWLACVALLLRVWPLAMASLGFCRTASLACRTASSSRWP